MIWIKHIKKSHDVKQWKIQIALEEHAILR